MATLLLTAVGTALGGPIGGAIGGLIGRQVDGEIFGGGAREGARLSELSVTTSSYGQPIPRIFGRMRVAGTVIWSTDLAEQSQKQGGGKGSPSTTTYTYSVSFAVALSSTPIARIGRIWADGNLLRGSAGDLKVEGQMRTYLGDGLASVDPVIAADKGELAPAFRDTAYVVFEDLQLGDFGNRIPALTFEVFAKNSADVSLGEIVPKTVNSDGGQSLDFARGFADEGGSLAYSLAAIDRVYPLACVVADGGLNLASKDVLPETVMMLPEQLSQDDSEEAASRHKQRADQEAGRSIALRYYDEDRDYQPGVQRAVGRRNTGREQSIDLPATLTADGAKQLANSTASRSRWRREQVSWRVGELNPQIRPGSIVKLPGSPGNWLVKNWEWFDRGIELGLERVAPTTSTVVGGDAGTTIAPVDVAAPATELAVFELPPDGSGDVNIPQIFAAAGAVNSSWSGAALYIEQGTALVPVGTTGRQRSVIGALGGQLNPSGSRYFEPEAYLLVTLPESDLAFENTDLIGLANGANKVTVAGEIIQFLKAEKQTATLWKLSGLLRGRGGTEDLAAAGHAPGAPVVLIDESLTVLNHLQVPSSETTRIAAIGRGDEQPVYATLKNSGLSRRPPAPVHARSALLPGNTVQFRWTRRARGQWQWDQIGEVALIENTERYLVGYGPTSNPYQIWETEQPTFELSEAAQSALTTSFGPDALWVRQIGTYAQSSPLVLANLV
ncbi:phage tail protein [Erythrobacter sp. MTPC3]|uniref:phage tail protein n=1 Tax=Erythrobacter sp. MTPC3 TaxID=3056564 RepID=UPI0036F329C8